MCVDLDPERNLHLASILKRYEYNVFGADNARDVMRISHAILPNLVLMDLHMPRDGGRTLLEEIRSEKALNLIKIVVIGENAEVSALKDLLLKGANGYLTRPVGATDLYKLIHGLIEVHPRQTPRLRIIFKVTIEAGGEKKAFFATRVSEQGIFIRTLHPFPIGTKVRMNLELPSKKPPVIDGEVIYDVSAENGEYMEPGMGIRFMKMERGVQEGIARFIEAQLTGEVSSEMMI